MERIENTHRSESPSPPAGESHADPIHREFLRAYDVSATTFGRLTVQDPRFVYDLRNGREPRPDTEARVQAFIAGYKAAWESSHAA